MISTSALFRRIEDAAAKNENVAVFIRNADNTISIYTPGDFPPSAQDIPAYLQKLEDIKRALVRKYTRDQRRIMRQGASDDSGSVGEGNAVRPDSSGPGERPA
jgi:hypothetical protein